MKKITLLFLGALALFSSCAPAKLLKQTVAYEPGYSIRMRQKIDSEMLMTMFGEQETQYSTNISEFEYHVTAVAPDGRITWSTSITRFVMENDNGVGQTSYDTQDPDRDTSDVKTRMLDRIVGQPMHMTTKADGEILEFSGASALFDTMMASFQGRPEMAPYVETIKKSYGDSAMIESVRSMFGYMPKKPVRIGQTWTEKKKLPGVLSLNMEYGYKLKSRNAQEAVISVKSKSSPGVPSELDMGVVKIVYDLSGNGTGLMTISQPDGMLKQAVHTITLKGIMHMSGESFPKMDVPITTKTTVTTECR